ncbi:MAG TPA: hypothetical protein VJI32_00320 [Candidatus Nanoarchaeia archaeon]|nr:hypothetical protein [Candidatus Nanoarchaeia archaeon]
MTTLQNRILHEFTPKVEQLMDIYARDWRLPLTGEHADEAVAYMRRLATHTTFKRIDGTAQKIKKIPGAPRSLAARLYDHDLIGEITYLQGMESIVRREPEFTIDDTDATRFMRKLTTIRLFGLTMGYLASDHQPGYLSFFPPSQLDYLLTSSSQQSREIHTPISTTISNVEYVALHQIIKNAPARWELYANNEKQCTKYRIQDFGAGICHKDKTPLTADELPEIFNEFSTKDSGHGLQIARHLIHSLGGHIDVVTTTEKATLRYSTRYEKAESSKPTGTHGTLFSVYVPRGFLTARAAAPSLPGQISLSPHSAAPHPERELAS